MTDTPSLIEPFASIAKAAGLPIPEDRIAGVNGLVADLYAQAAALRGMGLSPVDEPANIYPANGALK